MLKCTICGSEMDRATGLVVTTSAEVLDGVAVVAFPAEGIDRIAVEAFGVCRPECAAQAFLDALGARITRRKAVAA